MNKQLIINLYNIGAVKFGDFTLKSGIQSPIYIDLRKIISYPQLLKQIGDALWDTLPHHNFDVICGVPYTALPIATYLSITHNIPMVMRRKEKKEHGTKQTIEGDFDHQQRCLIIEDLVTSGASVFETIRPLEEEGLNVTDVIAFLNREQGAAQKISEQGYHFHSTCNLSDILATLEQEQLITSDTLQKTEQFIACNQF